jgi:leader peptidase (prepilin peptidase)/N-methyltransferase
MLLKILICAAFFIFGGAVYFFLNKVIEKFPVEEQEEREPKRVRRILIALLGGVLSVLLYLFFGGYPLELVTLFLFFGLLTVIAFIDLDTMEIPFVLNVIIFVLGIISIWSIGGLSLVDRLIGMICVSGFLLIFLLLMNGFGGGDVKLMFAAGFLLGWKSTVTAFFISLILGGIVGIVLLIRKKKGGKDAIPFGPYLCAGLIIASFIGNSFIDWYIGLFKNIMDAY